MRKALIHRFFRTLNRELGRPAQIILTGAAAGSLLGVIRPSLDIDFEIRIKTKKRGQNPFEIREAIQNAAREAQVAVNYSEEISHWSMINLLEYRQTSIPYRTVGQLEIRVMAPAYWTIGKMGRFYEVDIRDVLRVIRRKKIKPEKLIPLWGRALRRSPLSLELGNFRRNVSDFIRRYGRQAWGKGFHPERGIALFEKRAGIK